MILGNREWTPEAQRMIALTRSMIDEAVVQLIHALEEIEKVPLGVAVDISIGELVEDSMKENGNENTAS